MAERSSRRRPFNVRYLAIALVVVIIAATVLIGVTLTSSSPLPVLNASYKCVPGPLIPQLKPGQSGTINASYGSFTATFRATVPAKTPAHSLHVGTPFKGTLTMIRGGNELDAASTGEPERGPDQRHVRHRLSARDTPGRAGRGIHRGGALL